MDDESNVGLYRPDRTFTCGFDVAVRNCLEAFDGLTVVLVTAAEYVCQDRARLAGNNDGCVHPAGSFVAVVANCSDALHRDIRLPPSSRPSSRSGRRGERSRTGARARRQPSRRRQSGGCPTQLMHSSGKDCCAQNCAHLSLTGTGAGSHCDDMNGRQFIARVRKWSRSRNLEVRFVASEGAGSHGTLYAGDRKTTVKDRKKEIGKGLLAKMLADLGIDREDF